MRLPVLITLILLIIGILTDYYLWRRLRKSASKPLWAKIQAITAVIFNVGLLVVICMPKRRGSSGDLELIMWALYTYFSIYIPKYLFTILDILAQVPKLWHRKRIRFLSVCGATLGVIVFCAMWWGALINRYNINVRNVDIYVNDLPREFDGFTIAQFSDLHVGTFGSDTSFVSRVVDKINGLDADIIAFTGDIVNRNTSEINPFVETLSRLRSRNGVVSILGNHDYGDYYSWPTQQAKEENLTDLIRKQKSMGWKMLNNDHLIINHGNDSIAIIGVENVGDPPFHTYGDLDVAYETLDDPTVKILLSHNPAHWLDDIKDSPDKNIALTLSGHTHAMQITVLGFSPAVWRYPTWGGHYEDNDGHQLYVNIGAGEVGVPARIGATPEITLITLRRK